MELVWGFIVLLACLLIGVRHGGLGLAVISGIGLIVYTFIFGYQPGSPPVDVILTILAVVTCAGYLQTSGGLTIMLKFAEKILRKNPKYITICAPITTFILIVLCGTGHVVYTVYPIIYDIAIKQNIRPERPMAVSATASQAGIMASPASVGLVSMAGFISVYYPNITIVDLLIVSIPSIFCGLLCAAIWSMYRGKNLEDDACFQERIKNPEQKAYIYGNRAESLIGKKFPKEYTLAAVFFLLGIACIAVFGSNPLLLPHFTTGTGQIKTISMTVLIQMIMLLVSAVILLTCNVKAKDVGESTVFKAGMTAIVCVYGVAWMADTFFTNYIPYFKEFISSFVSAYPWTYAVLLFLTSKFVNSQAAAVAIVVPLALAAGVDPVIIISFISATYAYFFIPTYPSDLACINFDRSGTTKIGKYILNHSFMATGMITVVVGCCVGYIIAHLMIF